MGKAVKSVAQVAVGAAIGYATGGWKGALVGGAAALYASSQKSAKVSSSNSEPSAQTVRSSKAPARFILGQASTGGVLVWAQEQGGAQGDGEWLHLVYVLAEGAIDGVSEIYLNEEAIASYGEYASYEVVINPTEPNAFLLENCPDWKDTQIGRGLSFVRLSLRYSAEKYPSGIPDVRFVVRGRNDIYDPRIGGNVYSQNTALHILWYLRNRCGIPDDEIIFETFLSAANVCDELVGNADGSSSNRYHTGCVIGADEPRTQVLQKLEQSCAGRLIRVGGKWMLQAGAYYGPADFEIIEDMVIGTVAGSSEVDNDSAINVITGTFVDPSQAWAETDYPEVRVDQWVQEDGGEASETLSFSYVTDSYQAQRLANIELRRRRAGGSLSIPLNFNGYNCRPGRVVRVNLPSLNINGEFIVTDWTMGALDGCTVTVSQYEPAIFDDAVGQPYNPIGFINLPAGSVGSPSNLNWSVETLAEVTQGVLSWTAPASVVSYYNVVVRQAGKAVQAIQVPASATQCNINGLVSGSYTMSVSAQGPLARSGEATITVNIDGPPVPESCAVYSTVDAITLVPRNTAQSLNGGTYEYYFALTASVPAEQATYIGQGLSLTHNGLSFDTPYHYYIRSVNAYGRSGFLYVPARTSADVGQHLKMLEGKITKSQLGQDLLGEIGQIDDIQEQLKNITDALAYDPTVAYATNDVVRQGKRLYQAKQAVPAAADGSNAPPKDIYWADVGQVVSSAGALASQVQKNTTDISTVNGTLTAQAKSITGLTAQIIPQGAGDGTWGAGDSNVYAGTITVQSVAADATQAQARRIDTMQTSMDANSAAIQTETTARTTADTALASQITTLRSTVGDQSAAIQTNAQALATANNKLSSSYTVKTEVTANGTRYAAGIALGVDYSGGTVTSQFLVMANRFAVLNTDGSSTTLPFVIENGQTVINSAYIGTGRITNAMIGDFIQSNNYVAGQTGWRINKDGTFEINGMVAGQGRMVINSQNISLFDANNILRMRMGWLG